MSTSDTIITELISRYTKVHKVLFHIISNKNDMIFLQEKIKEQKEKESLSSENETLKVVILNLQNITNNFESNILPKALENVEDSIFDAKSLVSKFTEEEHTLVKHLPLSSNSSQSHQLCQHYFMSADQSKKTGSTITKLINIVSAKIALQFAIVYSNTLLEFPERKGDKKNMNLLSVFYSALDILLRDCSQTEPVLPKEDHKILLEKLSASHFCNFNLRKPKAEEVKMLCDGLSQGFKSAFPNHFKR